MSFLLDTNAVSEWVKLRPDPGVVAWLAQTDEDRIFISVITLAELRRGIERLAQGQRRRRLDAWLADDLPDRFAERILSIDAAIADAWGKLVAGREAAGRAIGTMDAWIAATAQVHALTLVTRDVRDFEGSVGAVVSPWVVD